MHSPVLNNRPRIRMALQPGLLLTAVLALTFAAAAARGVELPTKSVGNPVFESTVRPVLAKHCGGCHGVEKTKGDFRIDTLKLDPGDRESVGRWAGVLKRVEAGEMPPKSAAKWGDAERKALTEFASALVAEGRKSGRTVMRRLNRIEYENSLKALLNVEIDVKDLLPADSELHGFDNVGEALHTSSFLLEKYVEAADAALSVAIANQPKPPVVDRTLSMKEERHVKVTTEKVFRHQDDGLVMFSSSLWQAITVSQFYPPDRGRYRFTIKAQAVQSGGRPIPLRIEAGAMLMGTKNRVVGYFDFPADMPKTIEFTEHLDARNTIRILPNGLASAQAVHKVGADAYDGPGLLVHSIRVEGPLHDQWPPFSHRSLFGDLPQKQGVGTARNRWEVVSAQPRVDADRIIRQFMRRAFRRPVTDRDVQPFMKLFDKRIAEGETFERSVRAALTAVLVSPDFLFLREQPGRLGPHAVAARLAYFLGSAGPDTELDRRADSGELTKPAELKEQVERLLKDPRSKALTRNFLPQWLGLREIDFTEPSHILYPDYDPMLRYSMMREVELFWEDLLRNDRSVLQFVRSDESFLNGRLAKHYGIAGIDGAEFRRVTLPAGSGRGGVMTMAAVLKVTANGTTTSPVVRGAWVLDRILGTPPPKPPADVPAIEPDIRGAVTIRQQLSKHRADPQCAACHDKIDPPGFALEAFDVIGGRREFYRTSGRGEPVVIDGRRMHYLKGPKVDCADTMADGAKFENIDEFKKLLLRDPDQIARALTVRLTTYATGAAPSAADLPEIDRIVERVKSRGYGLRSLIHEIVASPLFQTK